MKQLILALTAAGLIAASPASAQPGRLVIVGGALEDDNAAVYDAFLDRISTDETGRIAVISAASGSPAMAAQSMVERFERYGIAPERVDLVRLAVRDDDETDAVDESQWAGNAQSATEIAKVANADAIWFTGGDQVRLTTTLLDEAGADTPMLEALRERLANGATLGGTSAGAAIMSEAMIARGDSLTSLVEAPLSGTPNEAELETGRLFVREGLGFFPYGLVDQHFGERARLGRLARAVALTPAVHGFGIDENTGLVVDLDTQTITAVGAGHVTWINSSQAAFRDRDGRFEAMDLQVSLLSGGDRLALNAGEIQVADYKAATVGNEYFSQPPSGGGGMAVASNSLASVLGDELVDNSTTDRLDRVSFRADGHGVLYRFDQASDTFGFWGRDAEGVARYTILNVEFDILPADISVDILSD